MIKLPLKVDRGLVLLLAPAEAEVADHESWRIPTSLDLPEMRARLRRLADEARERIVVAIFPQDLSGSLLHRLADLAAAALRVEEGGEIFTIKAVPEVYVACPHAECREGGGQMGLPEFSAVLAHVKHGGQWREENPQLPGTRQIYSLQPSPDQAAAIQYGHAGRWLYCAETSWSRVFLDPVVHYTQAPASKE